MKGTQADRNQQNRFQQLEERDETNYPIAGGIHVDLY
jgi:hypothetical protein